MTELLILFHYYKLADHLKINVSNFLDQKLSGRVTCHVANFWDFSLVTISVYLQMCFEKDLHVDYFHDSEHLKPLRFMLVCK